jgi:hypothetical protein
MVCRQSLGFSMAAAAIVVGSFLGCSSPAGSETSGGTLPGTACPSEGSRSFAADGCNTCECLGGSWACTSLDCSSPCREGAQRDDGCNSCVCTSAAWSCTAQTCEPGAVGQCQPGDERESSDGCNTCTCAGGQWACTTTDCSTSECVDGETRTEECEVCTCDAGDWQCSPTPCMEPLCPAPSVPTMTCPAVVVYARNPVGETCCEYADPCQAPDSWTQYDTADACAKGPPPTGCKPGVQRIEACNTCTCTDAGEWACTTMSCVEECEPGTTSVAEDGCSVCRCTDSGTWACAPMECAPECVPGETRPAGDECNTCRCEDGEWICSTQVCTSPDGTCAPLDGLECPPGQYCVFAPGAPCEVGTCEPLTGITCPAIAVCGCDGATYDNPCDAIEFGMGIMSFGVCPATDA